MQDDALFTLQNPTEEHHLLRQMVRDFVKEVVEPQAEEYNRDGKFNLELLRQVGELGLLGVTVPAEWGGSGMDVVASVLVHHEIAKSDPGFGLAYLAHAVLFVNNFYYASNDDQKTRYLAKTLTGEHVGCMCMTEPNVGTDVIGMTTNARLDGDHYVLNGQKALITNAPEAQLFLVYAKVDGRITAFVVEGDTPGLTVPPKTPKAGMKASSLGEVVFEDCRVPAANVLGVPGGGLTHMMRNLEIERLTLAALSLGIADRCVDEMIRYAADRKAFGKPIADFGQIQRYIADSFAMTEAARTLIYTVARDCHAERRNRIGTDAAKLFAGPVGKQVADNAMQVMGGWGYCEEYQVERFWRDAKLIEIGGGTIEAHQKNLTKDLVRERVG
ncbi:MAG: acyl-CoA dehydrogenase family protein [Deltaproteobacteria bacterium]|jgi:isovaleryl-CoA dehydrogenase|nr:acyl-CoA dehydrogenase family protein [Deltaproteobacteria bacterium]MBW2530503.1 acyl-CoA dehydrogenase family protein [Deltaproteobacteria bacterium]